jgi:hypothetical protein
MPDRWGLGTRVPGIIVSPFSRGGRIDSTPYETVSILKLIEQPIQPGAALSSRCQPGRERPYGRAQFRRG